MRRLGWLVGALAVTAACAKLATEAASGSGAGITATSDDAGGAGGAPTACNGAACASDEWCANEGVGGRCARDADGQLGCMLDCTNPDAGWVHCAKRPSACAPTRPVCGCDGKVYASECDANAHGVATDYEGRCATPDDLVGCGPILCTRATEYCLYEWTGGMGDFACEPLPSCDGGDVCDCISAGLNCWYGAHCEEQGGAVHVSCDAS